MDSLSPSTQSESSSREDKNSPGTGVQKERKAFLFIDEVKNGTVGVRRNTKNKRSFVMQNVRREKYWSTVSVDQGSKKSKPASQRASKHDLQRPAVSSISKSKPLSTEVTHVKLRGRQHCQDCLLAKSQGQWRCIPCSIFRAVQYTPTRDECGGGQIDPFGALPVQMDKNMSSYADHWLHVTTSGGVALDVRRKLTITRDEMFKLAHTSKALMHTLMSSAAIDTHMRGGPATVADITLYTTLAIAQVNQQLSDPVNNISDGNIAAVFVLLVLGEFRILPALSGASGEALDASVEQGIHMIGFKQMIELRGGLSGLGYSNRILQALILWYISSRAAAAFERPCLDIRYLASEYSRKNSPSPSVYPASYFTMQHIQQTLNVSEALIDIGLDLSLFVPEVTEYIKTFELDAVRLVNKGCLIQCRLISWLVAPGVQRHPIEDSLGLAFLIFNNALYNPGVRKFNVMRFIGVDRLVTSLKQTSGFDWSPCPFALLWLLVTVGICSDGSQHRAWCVAQIREACKILHITELEHLLDALRGFLWLNYTSELQTPRLWEEITHPGPTASAEKPDDSLFNGYQLRSEITLPFMPWHSLSSTQRTSEVNLPNVKWTYRQTAEIAVFMSNSDRQKAQQAASVFYK